MQVTIIGAGNVGSALGGSLVRAGHQVVLASRDAGKAARVAADVGATAVASVAEASRGADAVVLAVPSAALAEVANEIRDAVARTVVIDATNRLEPDFSGLADEGGPSNAERLAALLPDARVAKAFNTLFQALQASPTALGTTLDALYATDDDEAAATVAALASSAGFRPVRVGPLAAARELEAMAWLNIRLQLLAGGDWRSSFVLVGAPEAAVVGVPEAAVDARAA